MTETQIAKENIKKFKKARMILNEEIICRKHKQQCERFLGFLEEQEKCNTNLCHVCFRKLEEKIIDLKKTIKLYGKSRI